MNKLPVDVNIKLTDLAEGQLHHLIFALTDYKREKIKSLKKREAMWATFGSTYPAQSASEQEIEEITVIETQLYNALGTVVMLDNTKHN